MPAFHPRIRALTVGVSAIVLVAIGVGGTVAASNPPTLYACYDVNGNVRMSDSAVCKLPGGGRLASWGTVGVPGPTGLTGATGATGAAGATGATATVARHTGSITYAQQFAVPGNTDGTLLVFKCGFDVQLTGHDSRIFTPDGSGAFNPLGVAGLAVSGANPYTAVTTGDSGTAYVWNAYLSTPVGPTGRCDYDFYGSY